MLLNPEEPAQLRQRVTLQILQQKLADPANFPDEPPDNDPPPFDLKLRYYIELKTQDALDRARQATDEGAADALARLVANRRQMLGPWTPRCAPPPIAGLTHREQHRMEQRVYGTTAVAQAELHGLQILGQAVGTACGAGLYLLVAPQSHGLTALREASTPSSSFLPLVASMCVGSAICMLLLPALASQGGRSAARLRTVGWSTMCVFEPLGWCLASLGQQAVSAAEELHHRSRRAAAWCLLGAAPPLRAAWRFSRLPRLAATVATRARSALTQEALARELRMLTRVKRLGGVVPGEA